MPPNDSAINPVQHNNSSIGGGGEYMASAAGFVFKFQHRGHRDAQSSQAKAYIMRLEPVNSVHLCGLSG